MSELKLNERYTTIAQIHSAYNQKVFTPSELIGAYLKASQASTTNAYLTLCEERALRQAEAADQILKSKGQVPQASHPLFGIPLGIKDNLALDGVRMTCGSKMLEHYIAPYTATSVRRLEDAGGITLGKMNLDEFSMGGSNENSAYGPVRHPTHPDRVPGGSSGGSAAAVRAHLCVAALGSDTGGSIRLPASYCGIVGLKPTYGKISRYGLVAFASSLDQIGPMTHTVEDTAILLDVMSGHDAFDATSAQRAPSQARARLESLTDLKGVRIGVPKEFFIGGLSPEVEKSVEASLNWFQSQGAKLVPITLPHTQSAVAVYYIVAVSEASSNLARFDGVRFGVRPEVAQEAQDLKTFYESVRSHFGPEVKRRIILGTFALSSGHAEDYFKRACQVRRLIQKDFDQAFREVDFIVGPVAPSTAYRLGEKTSDPLQMYLNDIFTISANLAGLPAMSLPCGEDEDRLSIGLHLMAPHFQDEKLVALAHYFSATSGLGRKLQDAS